MAGQLWLWRDRRISWYQHYNTNRIESFTPTWSWISVFIRSFHEENCYCRTNQTGLIIFVRSVDTISISQYHQGNTVCRLERQFLCMPLWWLRVDRAGGQILVNTDWRYWLPTQMFALLTICLQRWGKAEESGANWPDICWRVESGDSRAWC